MNTPEDGQDEKLPTLEEFVDGEADLTEYTAEGTGKLMENIYRLETDLDSEKEERREERFMWVLAVNVLFDVIAIDTIDGSWLFLPIFLLQLIGLLGYARKLGVDWAEKSIGWLIHWISTKFEPSDKN